MPTPPHQVINVVTDYGADNTGISCFSNLQQALDRAVADGGGEIYFPPGTYQLGGGDTVTPLYPSGHTQINNVRIFGQGATIVCDTLADDWGVNGSGGGFTLWGNRIVVDGLSFEGFPESLELPSLKQLPDATKFGFGRLLLLMGDQNTVVNCHFANGNGGAVEVQGSYNTITRNVFQRCGNQPPNGGYYGAIQITSSSTGQGKYNTVSENKIVDHANSGISAYGTGSNNGVAHLDICNNYIRSRSSSLAVNRSMGIYLLHGANEYVKIIGNTIEAADAEGIIIESASAFPARKCLIANNVIRDGAFSGISLLNQDEQEPEGATFSDCTITGNIIENTSAAPDYAHQMWLDRVQDSLISGNRLVGYQRRGTGINFYNTCPRNQVSDNRVSGARAGILFYSADGALKDNHLSDCEVGIVLAYCWGASIVGNMVKGCHTGISHGTYAAPLHILGNSILDCEVRNHRDNEDTDDRNNITPGVLTHSGIASFAASSSFVTTGTLSKGKCTVVFDRVYQGDRFLVLPAPYESVGAGAMYVAGIDNFNNTVLVKSTDPKDKRPFTLIKMISGG